MNYIITKNFLLFALMLSTTNYVSCSEQKVRAAKQNTSPTASVAPKPKKRVQFADQLIKEEITFEKMSNEKTPEQLDRDLDRQYLELEDLTYFQERLRRIPPHARKQEFDKLIDEEILYEAALAKSRAERNHFAQLHAELELREKTDSLCYQVTAISMMIVVVVAIFIVMNYNKLKLYYY